MLLHDPSLLSFEFCVSKIFPKTAWQNDELPPSDTYCYSCLLGSFEEPPSSEHRAAG